MDRLLHEIAIRSEFLSERLLHACSETAESVRNVSLWQSFIGNDFFRQRLSFDNIGEKRMLELAGIPVSIPDRQPEWLVWLSNFIDSDMSLDLCYTNEGDCGPVFISDAFIPVIAYGQRKLQDKMIRNKYAKVLLPDFVKILTCDIVSLSHRCVFPELFGGAGRLYFGKKKDYKRWYGYLFSKYPVLGRLIFQFMIQWVENSSKMTERLVCDEQELKTIFGVDGGIVSVSMGISDRHNGGQSAAIVKWNNSRKIVYKPHSSLSGTEWNKLTDKFLQETYKYAIWERQGYSYVEFVEYETANDPDKFYFHSGELLALCMVTGASDLHCENIIAKGNIPVVVDTETIANPLVGEFWISPEECGLMPIRKYFDGVCVGDWGGLTQSRNGVNVPHIAFQRKYVDCVIDGFKSVMCKYETAPILSVPLRFVLRDTMTYSLIQAQCLNRKYMTDGFLYSLPTDSLSRILAIRKDLYPVYRKEQMDMEKMDIPYFYSKPMERGIYSGCELLVEDFFDMSINEHIAQRTSVLNDEKEIKKNIDAIRQSLESPKPQITKLEEILLKRISKKRQNDN